MCWMRLNSLFLVNFFETKSWRAPHTNTENDMYVDYEYTRAYIHAEEETQKYVYACFLTFWKTIVKQIGKKCEFFFFTRD